MKNNQHSGYSQPVGMDRVGYLSMKQINDGVPQATAGAPAYAYKL